MPFSKWPEVFKTHDITSKFTVSKLREVFARFGLPDTIVSDNGTQFTSEVFQDFVKQNQIKHITTAPAHPATNGAAENCVRSFKNGLTAALADKRTTDVEILMQRYLFDYRIAPHCTTFESPSKLMFKRSVRTRFDFIKPPSVETVIQNNLKKQVKNYKGNRNVTFVVNEKVSIRDLTDPNKKKWMTATIHKCLGPRTFICKTANGKTVKRHLNQIHKILGKSDESLIDDEPDRTTKRDHVYKRLINQSNNNEILVENNVEEIPEIVNTNTIPIAPNTADTGTHNDDLHLEILFNENNVNLHTPRPKRTIRAPKRLNL